MPAFLGQGASLPFRVDLSRPGDEWLLVAEFRIVRAGLLAEARRNALPVLASLLSWILLSLLLARAFGRHLAQPVKELSAWAVGGGGAISSRDLARRDEVGELARRLAEMRSELESEEAEILDRARAMESMNRIDRAVLAGGERLALLDKVLLAVLDYAPSRLAAVAVRDPDGGGFEIVALRGSSASPSRSGGFLPDELFPPALLVRYADAYEVPEGELGPELLSRLGVEGPGGRFFANLPFAEGDAYAGAFFLLRSSREPGLERLRPLADQVGVAFKHVATYEARERNWLAVVRSLTRAVDAKSAWTHGHSERVALAALALGRKLLMGPGELSDLEVAAVLHDVGKIGVPEAILDKPARLESEEYEIVKLHPSVGADIVEDVPEYREVRAAIRHHHERWDGSGYPSGLKGEEIPLAARIIALADVYDAITDERPYRKGMRPEEARDFMERGSGSLFEPRLVRLFLEGPAETDDSP